MINPLFASQLNGIQIKEVVFFVLSIFILLFFILAIIVIFISIRDKFIINSEIKFLINNEQKISKLNKKKYNQKVKFGLTYKLIGANIGLTILLIFLFAYPLSLIMVKNEEETLAAGLQRRLTVLMNSITNGSKVYLPTKNILELNLLTKQSDTIQEATSITILSYPDIEKFSDRQLNPSIDYVWASNDPKISTKIDTQEIIYGQSRINIPEINSISEDFIKLNTEAKQKVKKTSNQILELINEYKEVSARKDIESIKKEDELQILIVELNSKLETELHQIASNNLGSFPPYDKTNISKNSTKYLFYQPILYNERSNENFLKGIILIEVNIENLINSIEDAQKEILFIILTISTVVILIGIIVSLFLSFYIVKPIKYLQKHVEIIKNTENKAELFDKKVVINTKDEIEILSININEMTENLAQAAIYESMLLGGKEVQRAFLPLDTIDDANKVKLSVGHIETPYIQFFGYYEGAKGVSGDFFDFKKLDEKYFALIKCDVSGKGAPAALIMAEVSALFCDYFKNWSFEKNGINLQSLVYKINDHLEARNLNGKFAAFTLGLFDTISGDIYFCNAGDNIIHIYDYSSKELKTITLPSTPAVGIISSSLIEQKGGYPTVKIHLNQNDVLLLYTDGIEDSKRFFRNDENEIVKYIPNTDKIIEDKNDNSGINSEEFGKDRIKNIIESVFAKEKYQLIKKENPIKNRDMKLIFDFKSLEGTPEDIIMALISVEKIFRLYNTPAATIYDYGVVDKKIDNFLQLHFNKYDVICTKRTEHQNPDLRNEYMLYESMKEEEQTDDLTLVAIKKK